MALKLTCHVYTCARLGALEAERAGLSNKNGPLASRLNQKGKEGQDGLERKVDSEMVTTSEQVFHGAW